MVVDDVVDEAPATSDCTRAGGVLRTLFSAELLVRVAAGTGDRLL